MKTHLAFATLPFAVMSHDFGLGVSRAWRMQSLLGRSMFTSVRNSWASFPATTRHLISAIRVGARPTTRMTIAA